MPAEKGLDFSSGVPVAQLADGTPVAGHVGDDEVVVVRRGDECFAIGAHCTHYHGPLADGLVVGDTIRCPWHHACFDLRNGSAVGAPAYRPLRVFPVTRDGELVRVGSDDVTIPKP